jgi:hypothetical protein
MASGLIVHAGGIRRTREELEGLPTPAATDTRKPVPHRDPVASLVEGLGQQEIAIARERYTASHRDARLLGVLDRLIPDVAEPDSGMSLGLRGSNDKAPAIQAVAKNFGGN